MSETNESKNVERQLDALSKFPDQNPNPVLKLSMDGMLLYSNRAGKIIKDAWNVDINDQMPQELVEHAQTPDDAALEMMVGEKTYSFHVVAVPEFEFINVYATDVTAKKRLQNFLTKIQTLFSN